MKLEPRMTVVTTSGATVKHRKGRIEENITTPGFTFALNSEARYSAGVVSYEHVGWREEDLIDLRDAIDALLAEMARFAVEGEKDGL